MLKKRKISEWLKEIPDEEIKKRAISQLYANIEVYEMKQALFFFCPHKETNEGAEFWEMIWRDVAYGKPMRDFEYYKSKSTIKIK